MSDDITEESLPRKDLYEIFSCNTLSVRKKIRIIEALDDIDGYDLAFIVSLILDLRLTGSLNIISKKNVVSGMSFLDGFIVHIDLEDKNTYLGILFVEEGYIQKKDLDEALAQNSLPIGKYLLQQKKITDEQFSDIILKQMRLRLSKLICSDIFNINFNESSEVSSFVKISSINYFELCHDWIVGRFELQWLQFHFIHWEGREIDFADINGNSAKIFSMPLLMQLPGLPEELKLNPTLQKLKLKFPQKEQLLLKAIYFLSVSRVISFKASAELSDMKSKKFETLYLQLKNKKGLDLVIALATLTKVDPKQTDLIYVSFMKLLDAENDKSEIEYKNELIKIGINFLSNLKKIDIDKENKDFNSADTSDAAIENVLSSVRIQLLNGNYFEAMKQLKKFHPNNEINRNLKLYLLWAKIGHVLAANLKTNITLLQNDLVEVMPEDKETAEYYYVTAMLAKLKNDMPNVEKFYNLAVKKKKIFESYPLIKKNIFYKMARLIKIKI